MKRGNFQSFKDIHEQVLDVFKSISLDEQPVAALFTVEDLNFLMKKVLPVIAIRPVQFHSQLSVVYQVDIMTHLLEQRDQILWQLFDKCKDAGSVYKGSASTKIKLPNGELSVYMFETKDNVLHPANLSRVFCCSGRVSFYPEEK